MMFVKKFDELWPNTNKNHLKAQLVMSAKIRALSRPWKPKDYAIDAYLRKNYGIDLFNLCLKIVNNAKLNYATDGVNELIVTIPDRRLDELAALVTYGDSRIQGSDILRRIFR